MNPIDRGRNLANQVRSGAREVTNRAQQAVEQAKDKALSTVSAGRQAINQAMDAFESTAAKGAQAVEQVKDKALSGVSAGRQVVNQAMDAFESTATKGAQAVAGVFGGGQQPDRIYDGQYVGARGQTFPPGTPLNQIPGVTPRNNPNPSRTLLHVNGIDTPKDVQFNSLQQIADRTGSKVIGIHNATEGIGADLGQSVTDKLNKGRNPAVDTLADTLYSELKAGRKVDLMAHSQGGLVTSRALSDVRRRLLIEDGMTKAQTEKLMSNVHVETFGAASGHYPDGPQYVHYINRADPVPTLFGLGLDDKWNPMRDGGRGAVVHHFSDPHLNPIDSHSFDTIYLNQRVPFEDARAGRFK